eukprot:1119406-Lingulodinium_polyedra.AAC.1
METHYQLFSHQGVQLCYNRLRALSVSSTHFAERPLTNGKFFESELALYTATRKYLNFVP